MTTTAGTKDASAMSEDARTADQCPGSAVALRPVARRDLTDHDGGAHHPAGLRQRRPGHVAGLRLRHGDAALRRVLPEPVRQAVRLRRLHVRLHGQGARAQCRRVLRLDAHLVVLLHRRGRACAGSPSSASSCSPPSGTTATCTRSSSSPSARSPAGSSPTRTSGSRPILTLVLEGASVACITALACVILFKHGLHVDTKQLSLSGVDVRGMGLAVVACIFSLVGFEAATTMGAEAKNPQEQSAPGRDRQPAHHRGLHGLHGLRRGRRALRTTAPPGPRPRSTSWPRPTG